jgi:murein DD-endopeptidase MepM/ murein hydrolase activator NlpD
VVGSNLLPLNREANELRVKGITASFSTPTTNALLMLDPDTILTTKNFSPQIDRVWVIESVEHTLSTSGFETSVSLYSPMKNKYPTPPPQETNSTGATSGSPSLNPNGLIKPSNGSLTSGFRTSRRPNHNGVDLASFSGADIWAAGDGVVIDTNDNCPSEGYRNSPCGGGFGNRVYIDHGGGLVTRYAHMLRGSIRVNVGDSVTQGQIIGSEGNSGSSSGTHLHWEVLENGSQIDPASVVKL